MHQDATKYLHVKRLPNGNWTHSKTVAEFDEEEGAATDYRFCCEWEGVPTGPTKITDFR